MGNEKELSKMEKLKEEVLSEIGVLTENITYLEELLKVNEYGTKMVNLWKIFNTAQEELKKAKDELISIEEIEKLELSISGTRAYLDVMEEERQLGEEYYRQKNSLTKTENEKDNKTEEILNRRADKPSKLDIRKILKEENIKNEDVLYKCAKVQASVSHKKDVIILERDMLTLKKNVLMANRERVVNGLKNDNEMKSVVYYFDVSIENINTQLEEKDREIEKRENSIFTNASKKVRELAQSVTARYEQNEQRKANKVKLNRFGAISNIFERFKKKEDLEVQEVIGSELVEGEMSQTENVQEEEKVSFKERVSSLFSKVKGLLRKDNKEELEAFEEKEVDVAENQEGLEQTEKAEGTRKLSKKGVAAIGVSSILALGATAKGIDVLSNMLNRDSGQGTQVSITEDLKPEGEYKELTKTEKFKKMYEVGVGIKDTEVKPEVSIVGRTFDVTEGLAKKEELTLSLEGARLEDTARGGFWVLKGKKIHVAVERGEAVLLQDEKGVSLGWTNKAKLIEALDKEEKCNEMGR